MISVLDSVIVVLIVAAGMLAFVVLYNLNNININERQRELATLKVLGFYNSEVAAYVFRENVVLTIAGSGIGVALGKFLHGFIIKTSSGVSPSSIFPPGNSKYPASGLPCFFLAISILSSF